MNLYGVSLEKLQLLNALHVEYVKVTIVRGEFIEITLFCVRTMAIEC